MTSVLVQTSDMDLRRVALNVAEREISRIYVLTLLRNVIPP